MKVTRLNLTLRTRIYLSMLSVILISFIATGLTAYYNFKWQNEEYQEQRLLRKEYAVEASINYFLESQEKSLNQDSLTIVLSDQVCELANIHRIPISIFDLNGQVKISASSLHKPDQFVPNDVDPSILNHMNVEGNSRAVTEMNSPDKTSTVLSYWYINDWKDDPVAIACVRYDKSVINKEEIEDFLSNLTLIYIAIFIGASIVAFFLSNYITKSLQKITERMHNIELGKKNEPIAWESQDEIGTLVDEYNKMLQEVETSADLLKKSEREMAWREMAKQVAHEIKNPLTPMKLRIQHLRRAWSDQAPDFDKKLDTVSESLIEQIDALTNIANEFSNFAQMPKANNEVLVLDDIIQNCLDLYGDNDQVDVTFEHNEDDPVHIEADRDQISRVYINLITNAIQAIPENRKGAVKLTLKTYEDVVITEIKDNGVGIGKEDEDKIFVPNFTTKSTGTGLGLAMVKNIVINTGGDIWFKSKKGEGSSFFVSFPLIK